jgi:hypothetical protein
MSPAEVKDRIARGLDCSKEVQSEAASEAAADLLKGGRRDVVGVANTIGKSNRLAAVAPATLARQCRQIFLTKSGSRSSNCMWFMNQSERA